MEAERLLLIVEDDAAFARTLHRSFERRSYTVLGASTLEEGGETPRDAFAGIRSCRSKTGWRSVRIGMRTDSACARPRNAHRRTHWVREHRYSC